MSLIDDLYNALLAYATDECSTEIVDFSIIGGGGVTLNKEETFQFRVKVKNEGRLDMKNVTVQANGTLYADVALQAGPFGSSAVAAPFNLGPAGQHTTGFFRGKAKQITGPAKDIVKAQISSWNAGLDSLLVNGSSAGANEGKLTKTIDTE